MSFPTIPGVNSNINISTEGAINLLLASIAFEEMGLAHIINAEAEEIQFVLGSLVDQTQTEMSPTIMDLLAINRSVDDILRNVIKKEMLLQFKLEDVIELILTSPTTSTSTTMTTYTTTSTTCTKTTTTKCKTTTTTTCTTTSTTYTTTTCESCIRFAEIDNSDLIDDSESI